MVNLIQDRHFIPDLAFPIKPLGEIFDMDCCSWCKFILGFVTSTFDLCTYPRIENSTDLQTGQVGRQKMPWANNFTLQLPLVLSLFFVSKYFLLTT
jgi:hypothetical protein